MKYTHILATVLVLGVACGPAAADQDLAPNSVRVAIDKETGQLRAATAREAAELARLEALQQDRTPFLAETPRNEYEALMTLRQFPSGYYGMELPLSLYSSLAASRSEDGDLHVEHVHSLEDDHEND